MLRDRRKRKKGLTQDELAWELNELDPWSSEHRTSSRRQFGFGSALHSKDSSCQILICQRMSELTYDFVPHRLRCGSKGGQAERELDLKGRDVASSSIQVTHPPCTSRSALLLPLATSTKSLSSFVPDISKERQSGCDLAASSARTWTRVPLLQCYRRATSHRQIWLPFRRILCESSCPAPAGRDGLQVGRRVDQRVRVSRSPSSVLGPGR